MCRNCLLHLLARHADCRLSEDVQSSVLLHSQRLSAHSLEQVAQSTSRGTSAQAAASATSPSSVASGYTRDAAFSMDGSSIAEEGRSVQSRVHLSLRGALLPSNDSSWPLTFGETSRVSVSQTKSAQQLPEQQKGSAQQHHHDHHHHHQQQQQQQQPVPASALASSSRHRILGEIEGLIRTLKGGGSGA
jgi:hypothetical protein